MKTALPLILMLCVSVSAEDEVPSQASLALEDYHRTIQGLQESFAHQALQASWDLTARLKQSREVAIMEGDLDAAQRILEMENAPDVLTPALIPMRSTWTHSRGYFHRLPDGLWVEKLTDHPRVNLFTEVASTPEYIELRRDGGVSVRLFGEHSSLKDSRDYRPLYRGEWTLPNE